MAQAFATTALILITAAALAQIVFLIAGRASDPVSHWGMMLASLLLLAVTVLRSVMIRFPAVTNTYESLVFYSAMVCAVTFVLRLVMKAPVMRFISLGLTVFALALLMISSSPLAPRDIQPPIPALQSLWLVLHVTVSFIGEAFFAVGLVSAIVFLVSRSSGADRIMSTSIAIGYPIFTVGALIFGAVWAEVAWGKWWSWDPKETWALVTWLVYTAYLHTRLVRRLHGRISAVLAIVGFAFTAFTFFGVNFLLSSLHGYG